MASLWQLTAPRIPTDEWRAVPGTVDAIVVGAGLTGLVTAVLLARAGVQTVVLEAREIGAATTGNTTGKLSILQGDVFSEIRQHSGDDVLHAYAQANLEGQAWLLRESRRMGIALERRPAITYVAADTDDLDTQLATLEAERAAMEAAGIEVVPDAMTEDPVAAADAMRLDDQAQLQPMAVLAGLADELRERGGRIVTGCRVRDVQENGEAVSVVSDRGTVEAARCVLATGFPILDRGLFFAKLDPSRSYAAAYRLPHESPPRGMYLALGSSGRSLRTATGADGEEILVVGGGPHVTGRSPDTARALGGIDAWTAERFSSPERVAWWGAQDYRTHWRLPFAGALPRGGGRIYTATGYNKWGMTNAVAAGLTIAADMLGGRLEWAHTLRERALRIPAVKAVVGANAEVGRRVIVDWASSGAGTGGGDDEPAEGDGIVVREGASPIAISRVDGSICRLSAVCPHLGGIVTWNRAERSWDCPLHASRFSATGERLEGPAVDDLASAPV
ncbi:MAG TPA: FAD-dependent oxidoreductase [Candidatus Microbacterium pullistercoris]|nr:FAD-dependent oxidoreductase [Candidatus Microbacterium pullistercoris]